LPPKQACHLRRERSVSPRVFGFCARTQEAAQLKKCYAALMTATPDTDHPSPGTASGDQQPGRILPFRSTRLSEPRSPREPAELVIDDLGKYARANARDDDYSHRMMVNIAALVFVTALAAIAIWLASTMAQNRKNQDCVLSGRRNCVSIDPPALRDYAPP